MTHLPKHPDCKACQIAKMKASHCRRVPEEHKAKIDKFGQGVTADTLVSKNEASKSYEGSRYAIIWYDEGDEMARGFARRQSEFASST
jgi:hypothetical protein